MRSEAEGVKDNKMSGNREREEENLEGAEKGRRKERRKMMS
jgi:hypothetical protein